MEIAATDLRGTMASAPVALVSPKPKAGPAKSERTAAEDAQLNREQVKQMVQQMQRHLDSMNVSLQYSFYGARGDKVAVQVVNRETGQVVREIPSREMQALQTKIGELVGMIFNDSA